MASTLVDRPSLSTLVDARQAPSNSLRLHIHPDPGDCAGNARTVRASDPGRLARPVDSPDRLRVADPPRLTRLVKRRPAAFARPNPPHRTGRSGWMQEAATVEMAASRGVPRLAPNAGTRAVVLLDGHGGASALESSLGLLRRLLVDLLEYRLRGALYQVLRLLQAEARESTDLLDDLDLLLARSLKDDIELVLLFLGLGRGTRNGRTGRGRDGDRGGGGDPEGG